MPKQYFPLPEIIVDGDVDVVEGVGSMNNKERVMRVPLGSTPADRHVRAHEMAHAKYSPESPIAPASIHRHAVQRAEDMRMNLYCRRQGLDEAMDAPIIPTREMMDQLCADRIGAVTAAASCFNTGDWPVCVAAVGEIHGPEFLDGAADLVRSLWDFLEDAGEPQWEHTVRNAQALMDFAAEPEPPDVPMPDVGEPEQGEPEDGEPEDGEGPEQDEQDKQDAEPSAVEPPADPSEGDPEPSDGEGEPTEGDAEGEPGEGDGEGGEDEMVPVDLSDDPMDKMVDEALAADDDPDNLEQGDNASGGGLALAKELADAGVRITEKPLDRRLPVSKLRHKTAVPSDRGRVPKYMGRYCTDRAVFSSRGKRQIKGGTILVDCSMHMGLDDQALDRLMTVAPTARIASYRGCNAAENAKLFVIADNGRRTSDSELVPRYGCSCSGSADIPVLKWLASFKDDGPLFWLCKDGPSGVFDERARDEVVRKHDIRRLESIEDLISAIKRGR